MHSRIPVIALISCLASIPIVAQEQEPASYQVPRTSGGEPDLQEVWSVRFSSMLERPEGMPLVLNEQQAAGFAQAVYEGSPDNIDPDIDSFGPPVLAKVKGEYRSSVIVYPENGQLPYNERGIRESSYGYFKDEHDFDHPSQRPGVERCLEGWGFPPMRAFAYMIYHSFVQTGDDIAIVSEDNTPLRVIHMDGGARPDAIRTMQGYSVGHWEGDTLVVETTHFRPDLPARATIGRPMLISGDAKVTERFTRVSDDELFYQYTVDDPTYYTEPFRGEYSFNRDDHGHIYEYSCHEGNYSMVGGLRGARVEEIREELGH